MRESRLSIAEARRMAIKAQRFSEVDRKTPATRKHLSGLVQHLGAVQLDAVNVLVRSHYLPLFSRLGDYPRETFEAAAWGPRPSLFEYWGHEASLMPVQAQPLFRWRMARARSGETWSGLATFGRERADFIAAVLERIEKEGPVTGGDFAEGPRAAGWWNWSHGKRALEWLFWVGDITTRTRRGFERVYDLTERVIPTTILNAPTPTEAEAHRNLIVTAANAMGVATAGDLRDYFRLPVKAFSERLLELQELGELSRVDVEGWTKPAFMGKAVTAAERPGLKALVSPFDNLIWSRERAERLFGVRIRLEIYTPAHRRTHGYYVLPLLLGDRVVARVDLKADRGGGLLRVQAAHLEPHAKADEVADALASELHKMARWLGLREPRVVGQGELSTPLIHALARL